ncbi:MAG: hypothetical protein IJ190_08340 [Prevotella sp.]|nr:hypothetical protein [Prevotella sp.]
MKRKLLTFLLLCVLPVGLHAQSGDVNFDGNVNVTDIVELVNYLNGNPSANFNQDEADLDRNYVVDENDVALLSDIIMGEKIYKLTVSPKHVEVENMEHRIGSIDVSSNYEWILYDIDSQVIDNEDNWIKNVWQEDNKICFEYDDNYSGKKRQAKIVVISSRCDARDTVTVSIESGGQPILAVSPKEITVKNKEYGRDIFIELDRYPKWLEFEVEFIGDNMDWLVTADYRLSKKDDGTEQIIFGYSENYSGEDRVGKIVVKNERYKLSDTINVISKCADWVEIMPDDLPERYVRAQKREYNLIGLLPEHDGRISFDVVLRTGGISSQDDIGCEMLDGGSEWLEQGPITIDGCYLSYAPNTTTSAQTARLVLYDKQGEYRDTIVVNNLPVYFPALGKQYTPDHSWGNRVFIQPDGEVIDFILYGGANREVEVELEPLQHFMQEVITPDDSRYKEFISHIESIVEGNDLHIRLKIDSNDTEEERWQVVNFPVRFTEGCQSLFIGQAPKSAPSATQMRQALIDLYNATNGPEWYRNEGWCSDRPLSQWDLLGCSGLGDYVYGVGLGGNTLVGTIPENFGTLFEARYQEARYENTFDSNRLYGRIPDSVINHPLWQKYGWNVVIQSLWPERRLLEYDDLKLKLPTYEIDHVNGDLRTSDELFAKNKVNVVMIGLPREEMANLHLSYHNKGYGTIVSAYPWLEGKREDSEKNAQEFPINDIDYVWNCPWATGELSGLGIMGTWYVLDDKANLLACYVRDWDIPESWYASKVDSICRKYLGEPEEHAIYTEYTSTDYSRDGEVKQLQSATVGKGINLVFLGECFVDKDMEDGGEYDKQIAAAVEQFFAEEPYTSLRNRFNVYQVKAVAAKEMYGNKETYAIKENDAIAFEYAKKALGEETDLMMVNVIYKGNDGVTLDVNRSYTSMYYGSYVAYDLQGGRTINHEGGGHGLAFLLDEYVENGMDELSPSTEDKNILDQIYVENGGGANVDWHNTPSEVKWAHFINDSRYADEGIGVYEGGWLYGHGIYRPTENSMMRYADCGFNAPSREAIYKRVMKLSEGDDWTYDYETFVEFDTPARQAYSTASSRRARVQKAPTRRIVSRPPTLYKGTWRDAGKCEKIEFNTFK